MYLKYLPRWVIILSYIVIVLLAFLYILPYLWMVLSSFRAHSDPFSSSIFPNNYVLTNYIEILQDKNNIRVFANSLFVAFISSSLVMLLAFPAGYGFSRFKFRGGGAMLGLLVIIRTFPGVLAAIALFIIMVRLGFYDTYLPLVLANAMFNLPFAIWNLRTVFDEISIDMEESAMVEGCSRLGALVRVVLPITLPGIVATFAFVFILTWNEYLFATTFITTNEKKLVPTVIATAIGQFTVDYAGMVTMGVLATVPILIIFFVIQRYIIKGLSLGSVKG
jgi:ABC-type glycerol-3-phosphate transport system permease component